MTAMRDNSGVFSSTVDGNWRLQAACRNVAPNLFFPDNARIKEAKKICAQCPVAKACLEEALQDPSLMGVWGGRSQRERQKIRNMRLAAQEIPRQKAS